MDYEFATKEELFSRVKPALMVKVNELIKLGYTYVTDVDVWNYLIQVKWINDKGLMLSDIVHDIINADVTGIVEYTKDRMEYRNN